MLFGAVVALRRVLYRMHVLRSEDAGVPVIIVGNLIVGGSGKTPLVLWIARRLADAGWRPGIVSRGYGGSAAASGAPATEVFGSSDPSIVGDEPVLVAHRSNCPVFVGADRAAACRALLGRHPDCDVLVLDDGLQHYRLRRDVEIAVIDDRQFGNGFLLPAGPLRESRARLREVDAVVTNGAAGAGGYAMRLEGRRFASLQGGRTADAATLGARRVHAVAGIGAPVRFFRHLESLGLDVIPHAFADHHPFTASDLAFGDGLPVVMTEKDAVKCRRLPVTADTRFWMLPVDAELDPAFGPMLEGKLRAKLRAQLRGQGGSQAA